MTHLLSTLFLAALAFHPAAAMAGALSLGVGMASQFAQKTGGTGYLGQMNQAAGNVQPFTLDKCPEGVIDTVLMTVTVELRATAGGGPLVIGGMPMGVDDMDVLMSALFQSWSSRLDTSSYQFNNISSPQLRFLVRRATRRDYPSDLVNGGILTGSFVSHTIQIPIPLSLAQIMTDGVMFAQGASRVKMGQIDPQPIALSGSGLALTNYTVSWQSLAVQFDAIGHDGDSSQVGQAWKADFANWTQDLIQRSAATRLLFAIMIPTDVMQASFGDTGITFSGQDNADRTGANKTAFRFRQLVLPDGGTDITDGCTVICFVSKDTTVASLPTEAALTVKIPGATSLPYFDMQVTDPPPAVATAAAATSAAAAGTPGVTETTPPLPSVQPGTPITSATQGRMPTVATPAAGPTATTPAGVAQNRVRRRNAFGRPM